MRRLLPVVILTLALVASAAIATAGEGTVEKAGREFPVELLFEHDGQQYDLKVTGTALRKKIVVKVYAMAHYMDATEFDSKNAALEAALSGDHAMQITMTFTRDVGAEKIQNAYREGFEKHATEDELGKITGQIDQFVGYFGKDAQKDGQYILRSLPDGTVLVSVLGDWMDPIVDKTFSSVLWRIWLDDGSVVNRKDLVKIAVPNKRKSRR